MAYFKRSFSFLIFFLKGYLDSFLCGKINSIMLFTEQDLDNLSKLSRITIKEEEKQKMLLDIQAILGYVSEINTVSGESDHKEESFFNVVREDLVTHLPESSSEELLREAPETEDSYVKVKQVFA